MKPTHLSSVVETYEDIFGNDQSYFGLDRLTMDKSFDSLRSKHLTLQ